MILTPHIGGSTLEAQESIGHFVSQRLEDYWSKGSTSLSVNLPQINLTDCKGVCRIAHLHDNLPGVLARVNRVLGEENINISFQSLATEGELGYVVTDVAQKPSPATLEALRSIEGTIRHACHRLIPHRHKLHQHDRRPVIRRAFFLSIEPLFAQFIDGALEIFQAGEILIHARKT